MGEIVSNRRGILEDYISLLIERFILENPNQFDIMLRAIHEISSVRAIVESDEIVAGVIGDPLYGKLIDIIDQFRDVFPFLLTQYSVDYYLLNLIHAVHSKITKNFIASNTPATSQS